MLLTFKAIKRIEGWQVAKKREIPGRLGERMRLLRLGPILYWDMCSLHRKIKLFSKISFTKVSANTVFFVTGRHRDSPKDVFSSHFLIFNFSCHGTLWTAYFLQFPRGHSYKAPVHPAPTFAVKLLSSKFLRVKMIFDFQSLSRHWRVS